MTTPMLELTRVRDWWQYKLAPAVALLVATALVEQEAMVPRWPSAALFLVALAVCAAFVSIINDFADRADDAVAGKPNRQAACPRGQVLALLGGTIAAGVAIAWWWRGQPLLIASYAGSWLAFSLYSLRPFRLKGRGLAGVLCDAAGAHLFPALAAVLVISGVHRWNRGWIAAVAVWAFAYGLRGILWHQLADRDSDLLAGIRTFAVRHPGAAVRLGAFVAFPAELLALAVVLWRIGEPLPFVALALYALLLAGRAQTGLTLVVVVPKSGCISVLQEYYDVFLPVALLLCSAGRDWHALILLAAFVMLFPNGVTRVVRDFENVKWIFLEAARVVRLRWRS